MKLKHLKGEIRKMNITGSSDVPGCSVIFLLGSPTLEPSAFGYLWESGLSPVWADKLFTQFLGSQTSSTTDQQFYGVPLKGTLNCCSVSWSRCPLTHTLCPGRARRSESPGIPAHSPHSPLRHNRWLICLFRDCHDIWVKESTSRSLVRTSPLRLDLVSQWSNWAKYLYDITLC